MQVHSAGRRQQRRRLAWAEGRAALGPRFVLSCSKTPHAAPSVDVRSGKGAAQCCRVLRLECVMCQAGGVSASPVSRHAARAKDQCADSPLSICSLSIGV